MHKDELRELREKDLLRALEELEETWSETLLRGSDEALDEHTQRTRELEEEYLRRHPDEDLIPDPSADRDDGDDRPAHPEFRAERAEEKHPDTHAALAGGEAGAEDRVMHEEAHPTGDQAGEPVGNPIGDQAGEPAGDPIDDQAGGPADANGASDAPDDSVRRVCRPGR